MADFPTINFAAYQWEVNDLDYLTKWNAMQTALVTLQNNIDTFGAATEQEQADAIQAVETIRDDEVYPARDAAITAAGESEDYRDQALQYRNEAQQIAAGDVAITDLQPAVWQPLSANTTLAANGWYAVDFTAGQLTLTLPATPSNNDMIRLYKSAGNAIDSIIARNGQTIMELAEDMTIDSEITSLDIVFNGADWRIV